MIPSGREKGIRGKKDIPLVDDTLRNGFIVKIIFEM